MASEQIEAPAKKTTSYSQVMKWLGSFALGGAILAIVIALISTTMARYGLIAKLAGFSGFMILLNPLRVLALVALGTLVAGVVWNKRPIWQAAGGLVLSLLLLAIMYFSVIIPTDGAPRLRDISTDLGDPPQFQELELREDNLVPFNNIEEWRAAHRELYPDLRPVVIDKSPTEVLADARVLAQENGWEIAAIDPQAGRLEATAHAGYMRLQDDVIVELTAITDGSTRVDMRSVSRVEASDLSRNAERIREFLARLQAI